MLSAPIAVLVYGALVFINFGNDRTKAWLARPQHASHQEAYDAVAEQTLGDVPALLDQYYTGESVLRPSWMDRTRKSPVEDVLASPGEDVLPMEEHMAARGMAGAEVLG